SLGTNGTIVELSRMIVPGKTAQRVVAEACSHAEEHMLIQPNVLNLAILTVHVKQVPVQHGNLHWTLPAGGSLRGWQTEQVVAVRINYQQWALLFAIGVFLSRLPIALSQDQTQSPKSVALGTVKHAGGKDDI